MPTNIREHKEKIMKNRSIPLVKIQWQRHSLEETIWELEEEIRCLYPSLFEQPDTNLEHQILLRMGEIVTTH